MKYYLIGGSDVIKLNATNSIDAISKYMEFNKTNRTSDYTLYITNKDIPTASKNNKTENEYKHENCRMCSMSSTKSAESTTSQPKVIQEATNADQTKINLAMLDILKNIDSRLCKLETAFSQSNTTKG